LVLRAWQQVPCDVSIPARQVEDGFVRGVDQAGEGQGREMARLAETKGVVAVRVASGSLGGHACSQAGASSAGAGGGGMSREIKASRLQPASIRLITRSASDEQDRSRLF
jgi:hypothetical protein